MTKRKGYLFRRKKGGNFYVQFNVDGNRFVRSTGTANRRKAEQRKKEIMEPFLLGDSKTVLKNVSDKLQNTEDKIKKLDQELNPPPKLKHVFSRFLDSPLRPDPSDQTLDGYNSIYRRFRRWLESEHSDVEYLHEVTAAMVKDYAKHLKGRKVSASTFNQYKNLLRMVWRVLADECRLDSNPWDKIKNLKKQPHKTKRRALSRDQYENLLTAAADKPDLRDLFQLLAWTGLRLKDAVLLKWSSVDFSKQVISLVPAKTARRQGKLIHIPIFPIAEEVLNRRQGGLVDPSGYVFSELAEQYRHESTQITKQITDAFHAAGMNTNEKRAGRARAVVVYGAHSFRHLFVTQASSAGMPSAMIKSITGHATDDMLEHYQQMGASIASEMAERIQGGNTPKLLQTANTNPTAGLVSQIRELAERMDAETWQDAKKRILELTEGEVQR